MLTSYNSDELKNFLITFPSIKWFFFSQKFETPKLEKNIYWETINENTFSKCLASCKGVITAAGFSTLSEALYLKKPVLTIPIGSHIEQIYNAKMIREMGGIVIKRLSIKHRKQIQNWIKNPKVIPIKLNQKNYEVVDQILIDNIKSKDVVYLAQLKRLSSVRKNILEDGNSQIYYLDPFAYSLDKEILKGKKKIKITNFNLQQTNTYLCTKEMFNLNKKDCVVK